VLHLQELDVRRNQF